MMIFNKSTVFILILVIVAACGASKATRKSKSAEKKQHSGNSANNRGNWPNISEDEDCKESNQFDMEYLEENHKDDDVQFDSPAECGLNNKKYFKPSKDDINFNGKSKWRSFLSHIFKLQDTIEDIRRFGKKDSNARIINGDPVRDGEWPWLVALGTVGFGFQCGGTVIADKWVLTAAHCFNDKSFKPCHWKIKAGARNYQEDPEGHGVESSVAEIIRHPLYDRYTNRNDIALLKLEKRLPLDPNSHINAACLPKTGRSVEPKTICKAAGWGATVVGEYNTEPEIALQIEIPIKGYDKGTCFEYSPPHFYFLPGMVCAGHRDGTADTCQGDSGGPLTCLQDGKHYLLGATSYGYGCAIKGFAGVYTDVGQYLHWIASAIKRFS